MFYIFFALKVEENGCYSATFDGREKIDTDLKSSIFSIVIFFEQFF
jgi:hypothetical protein